jgi:hypothetical protein
MNWINGLLPSPERSLLRPIAGDDHDPAQRTDDALAGAIEEFKTSARETLNLG